jgi:beta-phosphoglucomutase-like phosphatase (HAD superfamily)
MAIEAVIFDCDGTLVDSEPLARSAWERTLAPYGYAVDEADYPGLVGLPFARVHGFFAERVPGLPPAEVFWEDYAGTLFGLIDTELRPFADALATVEELREGGIAVAVASSSPRARLDKTLARAGLADAFAVTVAGDEVEEVYVAPVARGTGVAGALLAQAEAG